MTVYYMYIFLVDNATMATISTIATPSIDTIINISQSIDFETRSKVILKLKVLALAYIACMHAQAHEVCLVSIPSLQLKMDPTKKLMDKIYCYCTPLKHPCYCDTTGHCMPSYQLCAIVTHALTV